MQKNLYLYINLTCTIMQKYNKLLIRQDVLNETSFKMWILMGG